MALMYGLTPVYFPFTHIVKIDKGNWTYKICYIFICEKKFAKNYINSSVTCIRKRLFCATKFNIYIFKLFYYSGL